MLDSKLYHVLNKISAETELHFVFNYFVASGIHALVFSYTVSE